MSSYDEVLVVSCDPYYVACRGWQEQIQKERGAGGLLVYAAALRCVPYVIPSHWAEAPAALADELCSTIIHADPVIRQARHRSHQHALQRPAQKPRHQWRARNGSQIHQS